MYLDTLESQLKQMIKKAEQKGWQEKFKRRIVEWRSLQL